MDILNGVTCSARPKDGATTCPTGVRYRYDITSEERTDEEETVMTIWICNEYWFPTGEYEQVQGGVVPDGVQWEDSPELHKIFRNAQHRRTDDLYNVAYRNKRTSETPAVWSSYIAALDDWNEQVSALASTFSTDVPELPNMP